MSGSVVLDDIAGGTKHEEWSTHRVRENESRDATDWENARKNPENSRESHNLTVTSPMGSGAVFEGLQTQRSEREWETEEREREILCVCVRERKRVIHSGDEIYSLPSARCINNDIGVFTSTHATKRVQGRLLYRSTGPRYITHPVESRTHWIESTGSIPIGLYVDTRSEDTRSFSLP